MPTSDNVHNHNTLSPIGFEFVLSRTPNIVWSVQSANVPGVSLGDSSRNYSTGKAAIPGDNLEYNEFTINFIVDESLNNWREIYNWMRGLAPTALGGENQYSNLKNSDYNTTSDATLILLTNSGNPNIIIDFKDVFPFSLGDVQMNITETSIEAIQVSVSFRYSYMNLKVVELLNPQSTPENIM